MSNSDLDLWPVDLESSWYSKCHVRDQSLYEIWAKSSNPRLNYWLFCDFFSHVMSPRDLSLLTLSFYSTSGVMRLNSAQNLSEID